MDWKRYYREEMESEQGRSMLARLWDRYRSGHPRLREVLAAGGVVSFPHTALAFSGPAIIQPVSSLLQLPDLEAVVALGVVHTGALPEPFRSRYQLANDGSAPAGEREAAWRELAGGFVPQSAFLDTPFGRVELRKPPYSEFLRPDTGILGNEFSLDAFFSLYRFAASEHGSEPPPVIPVYIGLTRNPLDGGFAVARALAREIKRLARPGLAWVTTGDVVHYGIPYGDDPARDPLPTDLASLTAHFRSLVEKTLWAALVERRYDQAFRLSEYELKSDQRYILPVISELLEPRGAAEILRFELSDYSRIFDVPPPCVVASALIAYSSGA